jgi:2,4-dienoyl-CoA reductase-like NADH-dependent reductase (Old Yellow Enzyme family)
MNALFTPLTLRHKTLKNRIVFGAHTANMAMDGLPGARHLGYYLERAKGGTAMIVVEPIPIHRTAVLTRGNMRHSDDAIIAPLQVITDACHSEGVVMIQQLYSAGQHGDFDNSFEPSWSPSGLPSYHDSDGSHAMQEAEILELIAGFIAAAVRAQKAGFDGVELYGAYNGLIEQFWLPWTNRRSDRWGGSLENRLRFTTEIIQGIRLAVGYDFIIGLNASIDTSTPVALQLDALCDIAAWLDQRKMIDYISCGTGGYFNFPELMPTFQFADKLGAPLAEALKKVVHHARVQAESHIRTPEGANTTIASGQADMVSIVRGQIADPHLANKARDGRPEDVRGCISCNQMCWGRRSRDYWISCLVNPSAGREFEWGWRQVYPCDPQKNDSCGRRRACRFGDRPRSRRTRPPSHLGRSYAPTRRRISLGRPATPTRANTGAARLVRTPAHPTRGYDRTQQSAGCFRDSSTPNKLRRRRSSDHHRIATYRNGLPTPTSSTRPLARHRTAQCFFH